MNMIRNNFRLIKTEAEEIVRACEKGVKFEKGYIKLEEERYENWKKIWRKLKNIVKEGAKEIRRKRFDEKKMQSEIVSVYREEDYGWLECNTDPKKAAAIFNMQEQMIETVELGRN